MLMRISFWKLNYDEIAGSGDEDVEILQIRRAPRLPFRCLAELGRADCAMRPREGPRASALQEEN